MKRIVLMLAAVLIAFNAAARIELPHILGSHMVLQRNSEVKLWGKATPGAKVVVTVSWEKLRRTTTVADDNGRWMLTVDTPAATFEPQTITISDGEQIKLRNILIGDVWISSGQSNMEMPVKGYQWQPTEGALGYIMEGGKYADRIRMFTVGKERSQQRAEDCKGEWQVASSASVAEMSATAYFFALNLANAIDVPIGIVTANWGGTRIESWMAMEDLEDMFSKEQIAAKAELNFVKPAELYCAMIAPISRFAAKGFLWYQGCSNLDDNDHYDDMMARMVERWRKDWGDEKGAMSFYYAMIAPHSYGDSQNISYPLFVECQERALSKIPNSGMAPTTDIGEEHCIHPPKKFEVGQRLAAQALAKTYGQTGFNPNHPQVGGYVIKDGQAKLTLNNCELGPTPWYGGPITGFEIAGADKVFHKANASVTGFHEITVWSDAVPQPVAVRYSFRNFAPGNLKSVFGIPAIPFRTDGWNDVR